MGISQKKNAFNSSNKTEKDADEKSTRSTGPYIGGVRVVRSNPPFSIEPPLLPTSNASFSELVFSIICNIVIFFYTSALQVLKNKNFLSP